MLVGTLEFELLIPGAESLKDKRRVIRSLRDRLHREHMVSVAEVALHDRLDVAVLGLAVVGHEGERVGSVLDKVSTKLRSLMDAEVGEIRRIIYTPDRAPLETHPSAQPRDLPGLGEELDRELLDYADDLGEDGRGPGESAA